MKECEHRWTDHGLGGDSVICGRCGARGTVQIEKKKPTHLERARRDYDESMKMDRTGVAYLGRIEGAIGHLICHLEGER
jgi:hypothetical protein